MKTGKNEILFPIFLQASLQTQDSFWIYLFEDLAYGICPFGSFIDKDTVCCKFKGKQFNFKFSDKTPEDIFEQLYELFRTKLNVCSSSDYYTKRLKFNDILENKHAQWKDIKKKNIKDIFIENYVIDMKKTYLYLYYKKYDVRKNETDEVMVEVGRILSCFFVFGLVISGGFLAFCCSYCCRVLWLSVSARVVYLYRTCSI